jgi:hypothetical protein
MSSLQGATGWSAGCDPRCRLRRQIELELLAQKLEFWSGLSVACQQQLAPVGRWQMNIDHLDGGELIQSTARSQSGRQCSRRRCNVICRQ